MALLPCYPLKRAQNEYHPDKHPSFVASFHSVFILLSDLLPTRELKDGNFAKTETVDKQSRIDPAG